MDDVSVKVSISGIDEVLSAAERLTQALKEARTLAGELASKLERLEANV